MLYTAAPPFSSETLRTLIRKVVKSEGKSEGDLVYIFCGDEYLLRINRTFLDHDTLTDIITFPASTSREIISGEIYISLERVIENAGSLGLEFEQELRRVVVHGVLHLLGYGDQTAAEQQLMRAKEDYYINLQPLSGD